MAYKMKKTPTSGKKALTTNATRPKIPKGIRISKPFGRMALTKSQEHSLDVLWSAAVKARAGHRCEHCLKFGVRLESHHFYGRRNKPLRHIVSNGFSLCHTHHRLAEEQPAIFIEWAIGRRGQEWYDSLESQARNVKVYKDYTIIKKYLESFL